MPCHALPCPALPCSPLALLHHPSRSARLLCPQPVPCTRSPQSPWQTYTLVLLMLVSKHLVFIARCLLAPTTPCPSLCNLLCPDLRAPFRHLKLLWCSWGARQSHSPHTRMHLICLMGFCASQKHLLNTHSYVPPCKFWWETCGRERRYSYLFLVSPHLCAAGEWESCPKAPTSASLLDTQCVPAFLSYYFSTLVSSYVMSFRGIFCLKYTDKDSGLY